MVNKIKYETHEEWLALRKNYIGGSDASAVIGLNPYKSAFALWAEKTGKMPEFEGNLTTKVGGYLEEFVAKLFSEETGKKVRRENRMLVNDEYPFACADLDRTVVGEDAILEIKTTNSFPIMKKLREGNDFPEIYYAQVVHYLAVTGAKKAYLAVLINCRELKIYELERDEAEINALMDAERDFWEKVTSGTAPAVDGSDSTSDALSAVFPDGVSTEISIPTSYQDIEEYIALGSQIKSLSKLQEEAANRVKLAMGEAEKAVCGSYRVSWKNTTRTSFDSKAYISDHPGIDFGKYNKVTNARSFRVTAAKA